MWGFLFLLNSIFLLFFSLVFLSDASAKTHTLLIFLLLYFLMQSLKLHVLKLTQNIEALKSRLVRHLTFSELLWLLCSSYQLIFKLYWIITRFALIQAKNEEMIHIQSPDIVDKQVPVTGLSDAARGTNYQPSLASPCTSEVKMNAFVVHCILWLTAEETIYVSSCFSYLWCLLDARSFISQI